jgi:DNA-binding GntR family transcriptional regulator
MSSGMPARKRTSTGTRASTSTRLHDELATRILQLQKERGATPGTRLIELDLSQQLGVSRTPIRGALRLLESRRLIAPRPGGGYELRRPIEKVRELELVDEHDEQDRILFLAIAEARLAGRLPDRCMQQELVRMFDTNTAAVIRILRQLAELGVVERNRGNGWTFLPALDTERAQAESYQLRLILEPAFLLEPSFRLDRDWALRARKRHEDFRKKRWRATLAIELYDINADFHESLARFSDNRFMLGIMQQQNRLRSFVNYAWDYGAERVHASLDEHLGILGALELDDRPRAAKLMRRHLEIASQTDGVAAVCCGAHTGVA